MSLNLTVTQNVTELNLTATYSGISVTVQPTIIGRVKGDKGDPFIYEDFTPEQLDGLKCRIIPYVYLEDYGAVGDGINNDSIAFQNAINDNDGSKFIIKLLSGKTYKLGNSIVLCSNITIDGYGAILKLGSNNMNMMTTKGYVDGVTRSQDIQILGGTYDALGYSGTNQQNLRCIFHKVDNLIIKDTTYLSNSGKYMVTLADTTNVFVSNITGVCNSDLIHLMGKNYATRIENIYANAGEDIIAVTTEDYVAYKFDEGEVDGLYIRNITGSNTTRLVLLGNTKYTIKNVFVDNLKQNGTGAIINVGDGGTTDTTVSVDNVNIKNAYSVSGKILLRHRNMGSIKIENTNSQVYVAREGTGLSGINELIVKNSTNNVFFESHVITSTNVYLENIVYTGGFEFFGTCNSLILKNCNITANSNALKIGGITKKVVIENCTIKTIYTGNDPCIRFNSIIDNMTFINCDLRAGSVSSPILYGDNSTSIVKNLTYNNCYLTLCKNVYFNQFYSGTSEIIINLLNMEIDSVARLLEDGSNASFIIKYSNIRILSAISEVFRFYASQNIKIYGNGWECNKNTFASGTTNITCYAQDLPLDLSKINMVAKSRAYNTNSALSCGIGDCSALSSGWYNLLTGAVYVKT